MFSLRGLRSLLSVICVFLTSVSHTSCERRINFKKIAGTFHQSPDTTTNISCPKIQCSPLCCARACSLDELCVLFSFSERDCACVMSEKSETDSTDYNTPNALWDTYVRECPQSNGYQLYTAPQPNVCLKYVTTRLTHPEADDYCKTDGARLVRVKTQDILDAVYQAREDYTGNLWVGAEDQVEGQHYWNDGTYLPLNDSLWRRQGEGTMDHEDCVMATTDGLADRNCNSNLQFVCQYPM